MIDFHCHILPDLDDGPRSWDESLEMARIAQSDGISEIVCTPHIKKGYATPSLRQISERAAELESRVRDSSIAVRFHVAAEVALERNLPDLIERGEIATIGGPVRYILLELPWEHIPSYTETVISDLLSSGITPIIAHLERYHEVITDPGIAGTLLEAGALAQVNSGSITGMFGSDVQETSHILLTHSMAHVIGSDAHSSGRRSPQIKEARDAIEDMLGKEAAVRLTELNASEILAGRRLATQPLAKYEGPRAPGWRRGIGGRIAFYVSRQLRGRR